MPFSKRLLMGIAGAGGVAATGGALGVHLMGGGEKKKAEDVIRELNEKELIEKVGLDCGENIADGSECSIKEGKKTSFKVNKKTENDVIFGDGGGKLKVYRENSFKGKLRFTVEGGPITLKKAEGEGNLQIPTLQEFEGYEIETNGKYLSQKDTVNKGKIRALGLPTSCSLPTNNNKPSICQLKPQETKAVKFDGKSETPNASASLTISQTKDTSNFGSENYRFTFTPKQNLTISNSLTVNANIPTDFRIKNSGGKLSLEKVWSLEKLTEKVGLQCSNNTCTLKSGLKINVKQGNNRKDGITALKGTGSIKVLGEQQGYKEGFKFEIQNEDITFTGGERERSSGDVTKIWNEDAYEIIEDLGKYYFSRRSSGLSKRWGKLGLPSKCLGVARDCQIDQTDLKNIKFHNKKEGANLVGNSRNILLNYFSTYDQGYPLGMKIKIQVKEATIKIPLNDSKHMILWKDSEVEFRIKDPNTNNPTIEKSFDINALAKKIGLKGECEDDTGCTIGGGQINVVLGSSQKKKVKGGFENKKIKYETGQRGFKREVKFILGEDIEFEDGRKLNKGIYELKESSYRGENIPYLSFRSK